MTAYIKTSTGEYPRHPGDIALDPDTEYAVVEWVDQPEYDPATQCCSEDAPINDDGVWRMTWIVRDLTAEEIEQVAASSVDPRRP
jgi:hypothetical protein